MGESAFLKGLWRGVRLQRALANHGYSFMSYRAMSSRLFVGGLSFTTEGEGLRTAFGKFGEVIDARIVTDRESGRSRGFGFVTFLAEADAETAKDKLNGQFLDGRVIRVDRASPRPAPPPPPPRLSMPEPSSDEQTSSQDWGSIPSPIAAVPQNAGLVQAASSSDLPSLSSLASSQSTTPSSYSVPALPSPPLPPPEPPKPSFSFNLDLSKPDPNFVPRPRPPRLRPSMMDYEFGLFSDTSKFPYNTNFGTGFLKVRSLEAEFDFTDIKEAAAKKKAEEAAAKQAQEAEAVAAACEAEVVAVAAKAGEELMEKQAPEVEGVAPNAPVGGATPTVVCGLEAKEADEIAAKNAGEKAAINLVAEDTTIQSQNAVAGTVEVRVDLQKTLRVEITEQALGTQSASSEPSSSASEAVAAPTVVSGLKVEEAEGVAAKTAGERAAINLVAEETAVQSLNAVDGTVEVREDFQKASRAEVTEQALGFQSAFPGPSSSACSGSSQLPTAELPQSELRQVGL